MTYVLYGIIYATIASIVTGFSSSLAGHSVSHCSVDWGPIHILHGLFWPVTLSLCMMRIPVGIGQSLGSYQRGLMLKAAEKQKFLMLEEKRMRAELEQAYKELGT